MKALQRNARALIVAHCASTMFMVGLIWTIHYVHYPLFAYVGETTYVAFQNAHVERIGRLLFIPWLTEGFTLIGVLALAFLGGLKTLRVPAILNGAAMAVVLVISGFWSACVQYGFCYRRGLTMTQIATDNQHCTLSNFLNVLRHRSAS